MTDTIAATEELKKALAAEEGARRWVRRLAVGLGAVLAIGAGLAWASLHRPPPPARFTTAPVAIGDVLENVQATGTVQPLLEVNVRAQANLLASRAQLEQAKATAASSKAQREIARVTADRTERLFAQNLASRADLDTAKGNLDAASATYDAAMATISSQQAALGAQTAQLRQSNANLGYTKIYSPVDGVVVTRGIDPGATVQSSFQVAVLFVIAQDLRKMRILADVDEADVGKIADGMDTDCVVDAFPGEVFRGTITQVRFSPNNVSGVVTYSAVVDVDNPDEKLRPGMTTTITVHTHEAHGVP